MAQQLLSHDVGTSGGFPLYFLSLLIYVSLRSVWRREKMSAVAAGSVVSGWEFLSTYYTARMVRVSGAGGLAFLILFSQFSAFFLFSSHSTSPLLANNTPRRARTEHRRAPIWLNFQDRCRRKTGRRTLGAFFMRAGVVLVLRHFSLSLSLYLFLRKYGPFCRLRR